MGGSNGNNSIHIYYCRNAADGIPATFAKPREGVLVEAVPCTGRIDTRYLLKLDDGALAYLRTQGFRHGAPDVVAALGRGEDVDPARYYFRVTMQFETASQRYGWLNRTIGVGAAIRRADAVVYDAYALR